MALIENLTDGEKQYIATLIDMSNIFPEGWAGIALGVTAGDHTKVAKDYIRSVWGVESHEGASAGIRRFKAVGELVQMWIEDMEAVKEDARKLADITNKEKARFAEDLERIGLFNQKWAKVALGVKKGNQLKVFVKYGRQVLNDDQCEETLLEDTKKLVVLKELAQIMLDNIRKIKNED